MEVKSLPRFTLVLALCTLCAALLFGAHAKTPETAQTQSEQVAALVLQGTEMLTMERGELQALLQKAQALQPQQDADAEALENLITSINYNLTVLDAAENGTLDELPQTGVENSWRYQNGVAVEGLCEEGTLNVFAAEAGTHVRYGVDVSYHQGYVDWAKVKAAGVDFAIIRCGYGSEWDGNGVYNQDDSRFAQNVRGCIEQGIPFGVYLYSYATSVEMARSEAAHTLRLIRGLNLSLPVFWDIEERRIAAVGSATLGEMAQVYCDAIQDAGYNVGIYSYTTFLNAYCTADNFNNSSWYRWVADYRGQCGYDGSYNAWQFSSQATVSGINGPADVNYWYGDFDVSASQRPNTPPYNCAEPAAARAFVTQLYQVCLGRQPDGPGLNNWADQLITGQNSGIGVAFGFIFSEEFKNRNYCNEHYATELYRAFLGRTPDSPGLADWVNRLTTGATREEVFNGFAGSDEFGNFCRTYNISVGNLVPVPSYGTVPTGNCSVCGAVDGVTAFVTRLYDLCLERTPDAAGLRDWTQRLWAHTASGRDVAAGFIFSDEFKGKNHTNADYVEYLYQAFLGRASDRAGKADWVGRLAAGASREDIFNGFVGSNEFTRICQSYGIVRG